MKGGDRQAVDEKVNKKDGQRLVMMRTGQGTQYETMARTEIMIKTGTIKRTRAMTRMG